MSSPGAQELERKAKRTRLSEFSDDPSTLSEPRGEGRARQRHLHLELAVDFAGERLLGAVTVTAVRNSACDKCELVLDTRGEEVSAVTAAGSPCDFAYGEAHPVLGKPLRIVLPGGEEGSEVAVRIEYATQTGDGGCSALQWLGAEQTKGKRFPYLFSQCQAIHARSLVPCQDTCEAKVTYSAAISCPSELVPLMSAVRKGEVEELKQPPAGVSGNAAGCSGKWRVSHFEQKVPVPCYLIAIVCGDLVSREIGPRSHVWSEQEMIDAAAYEFVDTEKFIQAGEEVCGPYEWGIYDLLVLPPSFPYGGMENPCLTFVTPTLLAGDRSQVSVVAHEIAHSWSGNLVTNHTWEDFWLNEGLTVFNEMKIVEKVLGPEQAALAKQNRWSTCLEAISRFGEDHNFTRLVPDLTGGLDPDDAFSVVPYVKGAACLEYLQEKAGGASAFEPFIRSYIQKYRHKTVTSAQFKSEFGAAFPDTAIDWDMLLFAPGNPPFKPSIDKGPLEEAQKVADEWLRRESEDLSFDDMPSVADWPSSKVQAMLDHIATSKAPLKKGTAKALCSSYNLLAANCELRCRCVEMSLAAGWEGAVETAEEMAVGIGRLKYTRPLYRSLKAYDADRARQLFEKNKGAYHPITAKMVQRDLE